MRRSFRSPGFSRNGLYLPALVPGLLPPGTCCSPTWCTRAAALRTAAVSSLSLTSIYLFRVSGFRHVFLGGTQPMTHSFTSSAASRETTLRTGQSNLLTITHAANGQRKFKFHLFGWRVCSYTAMLATPTEISRHWVQVEGTHSQPDQVVEPWQVTGAVSSFGEHLRNVGSSLSWGSGAIQGTGETEIMGRNDWDPGCWRGSVACVKWLLLSMAAFVIWYLRTEDIKVLLKPGPFLLNKELYLFGEVVLIRPCATDVSIFGAFYLSFSFLLCL